MGDQHDDDIKLDTRFYMALGRFWGKERKSIFLVGMTDWVNPPPWGGAHTEVS